MATTPVNFLREVRDELKKVVWPTRDEVIRLTGVVIYSKFICRNIFRRNRLYTYQINWIINYQEIIMDDTKNNKKK